MEDCVPVRIYFPLHIFLKEADNDLLTIQWNRMKPRRLTSLNELSRTPQVIKKNSIHFNPSIQGRQQVYMVYWAERRDTATECNCLGFGGLYLWLLTCGLYYFRVPGLGSAFI